MIEPKWTFPTLSQEEIRRNGGIPPPPEPIMPTEFTIQLYNPDQQVHVVQKSGQLLGSARWEFSMPQDVFRMPSSSILDRSQNDPIYDANTPKINFAWRKESKFTKELTCYVTGKSTDLAKKKSKEPDIAVAMFKGLRDITIYEPNLSRVEMEDPKGLEVVILLGAAVIRDVFFGRDIRTVFNVSDAHRKHSATSPAGAHPAITAAPAAGNGLYNQSAAGAGQSTNPPAVNPRTQWEIDAETARLKAQTEAEERARRKEEERLRRERERAAEEETKRLRRMVEEEERQRRESERKVAEETRRLQQLYGVPPHQLQAPMMSGANPQHPQTAPIPEAQFPPHQSQQNWYAYNQQHPPPPTQQQPYNYVPNASYQQQFNYPPRPATVSSHLTAPPQEARPGSSGNGAKPRRRSFLNLRGDDLTKLAKKRSSVF